MYRFYLWCTLQKFHYIFPQNIHIFITEDFWNYCLELQTFLAVLFDVLNVFRAKSPDRAQAVQSKSEVESYDDETRRVST